MSARGRWSMPGRPSAAARRSAGTPISRGAPGSAACSGPGRAGRRASGAGASRGRAAGRGGVRAPRQPDPVVIGDGAFVGARAEVAEGVRVGEGAVLSMGVYLGASTKIVDRATGEVHIGSVPPYAVVVPGSTGGGDGKPGLYCAVIVKTVDAQTRSKTGINELLRD